MMGRPKPPGSLSARLRGKNATRSFDFWNPCNQVITELSRAFALCAASDEATEIRDDVSFFQALQAALNKQSSQNRKTPEQIDAAIRQLVSKAITTEGQVIDVFTAAGLPKPDISILSDQFLAEVRGLKHKNVAAELLEKLLKDERGKCRMTNSECRTMRILNFEFRMSNGSAIFHFDARTSAFALSQRHLDDAGHRRVDQTRQGPR
ncbi:MAG: DUF3387 domain-containing protein [Verrucomicrobia bacterium]|nr:DUF3387 domain-containing protein [Verrucomicrobiota bacterium]